LTILSWIILGIFYAYGFFLLKITFVARKNKDKGAFINNLANSITLLFSLSINTILLNCFNVTTLHFIIFPFDIFIIIFIIVFFLTFYLLIKREKKKSLKSLKEKQSPLNFSNQEFPLKYDIYRKLSHLVVLGIIFFYFTLGSIIKNFFIYFLQNFPPIFSKLFFTLYNLEENKMIFTQYLVVFLVGISLIGLLTADFVRILKPQLFPLKPVNRILKEKEKYFRLGPHISMSIGCFSIIIIYGIFQPIGPLIICTSMTISIFGDISSNLIGRRFGKKKIRNSNKTYIGLTAGIASGYFSGIICLLLLQGSIHISVLYIFIIPLIGSLLLGLIDYLDLEIDDNLTYNLFLSSVLFIISLFFL